MRKQDAILCYKTSMSVFKRWATEGMISKAELLTLETTLAEKYGISLSSIYREHDLLSAANLANIP